MNILSNIGGVYVQKGFYDSAFLYYQLAFDQIKPGIKERDLLQSQYDQFARQKKTEYVTALLLDKGDAYLKFYKATGKLHAVKEAVRIYKIADQLLDRIRTEQTDPQSKIFGEQTASDYMNTALKLVMHTIIQTMRFIFLKKAEPFSSMIS